MCEKTYVGLDDLHPAVLDAVRQTEMGVLRLGKEVKVLEQKLAEARSLQMQQSTQALALMTERAELLAQIEGFKKADNQAEIRHLRGRLFDADGKVQQLEQLVDLLEEHLRGARILAESHAKDATRLREALEISEAEHKELEQRLQQQPAEVPKTATSLQELPEDPQLGCAYLFRGSPVRVTEKLYLFQGTLYAVFVTDVLRNTGRFTRLQKVRGGWNVLDHKEVAQ